MINITEDTPKKLSGISSLFLSFKYNAEIINIIKTCDKYIYDNSTKMWELPITCLAYLLDELTYYDDITLKLIKEKDKEIFYPKLINKYKTKPFKHQLEGIQWGLNLDNGGLLLDDPGLGKAFTLDTKVLTPNGYVEIKNIHKNDIVFDRYGNSCNVTNEYNHSNLNMYRLTFSTGYKFNCCEDHLWQIMYTKYDWNYDLKKYERYNYDEVRDVKWLLKTTSKGTPYYKKYNCRIPFCNPVKFKENNHIIHPYILGYLIGDGSISKGCSFTTLDSFVVEKIKGLLPEDLCLRELPDGKQYRIIKNEKINHDKENKFIKEIKRLNLNTLTYFKHIPSEYLYDSIDNRLELLRGLMDSDGTAGIGNCAQFSTSSNKLKDDFEFLIQSLGGFTKVKSCYPSYFNSKYQEKRISKYLNYCISIHINEMTSIFSLPRKLEKVNNRKFKIRNRIINIEPIGTLPGKCLTVDSPSHTYLIDKCTVTHNTLQMIYLAEELKEQKGLEHCLIICGINTLKGNWKQEIEKHSNLTCRVIGEKISKNGKISSASIAERAKELKEPLDAFFYILNIESLRYKEVVEAIKKSKNKIDLIVFDECHKCANSQSQQSQGLMKLKEARLKIGLTGTLLTNSPLNAFTPLKWIDVEKSTLTNFKGLYCEYGGFGGHEIIGYKNIDILKNEIDSCSLRRTKDMLEDLPPKTVILEKLDMNDQHKEFYDNIKNGVKEEANKINLNPNNTLALTTRLLQATSCPSILTTNDIMSTKIERTLELVDEICGHNEKVVIMSRFKEPIYQLEKLLKEYHPLRGDGDLSDDQFEKNKKLFQEDNKYMVWLGTHSKSGTGITLNKASYMILLDCPWTAAITRQVEDRIHRIGSKSPVFIYRLICNNTIDEVVQKAIERKEALADFIIDDKADDKTINILKDYILNL